MTKSSIVNLINTGTSANAGNGDSLRTAFTKVNDNFLKIESSFIAAGVTSFNSQTGIVTFTATDISSILGYTPYSDQNPLGFVTSSTIALSNYASLDYVNHGFVTTSTLASRNYITKAYVDGALTEYTTYLYVDNQGFLTPTTLPNYLTSYVTQTQLGVAADNLRTFTTNTVYHSISQSSLVPDRASYYNIGGEEYTWGNLYLGGAAYFSGIGVNVDPVTARLYVNGNDILAGFTLTPTFVYGNDTTFRLSATGRLGVLPGDTQFTAGITLPSDNDSAFQPLAVVSTGTAGVTLQGTSSAIELTDKITFTGNINTPVTFKGLGNIDPTSGIRHHSLQFTPNSSVAVTSHGAPIPFITQTQTILSLSTATHAPLLIKGRSVALYASNSLDIDIGTSGESPGLLMVTPLGVLVGTTDSRGYGEYDELSAFGFGSNYILPKTKGNTGQVLTQGPNNYLVWGTGGGGNGSVIQSSTAPVGNTSTVWYDTVGGRSYVYYDSSWVDASPMPAVDTTQLVNNGYSLGLDSAGVVNLPTFAGSPSIAIIQTASAGIDLNVNGAHFNFGMNGHLTWPNSSVQTGASISIADLKTIITTCTSFTEFKNAILGL